MGIRASEHPALLEAYNKQLARENAGKPVPPEQPKVMWVARSSVLKFKPIVSRDPVLFMQIVNKIQEANPGLRLHIFEIKGI